MAVPRLGISCTFLPIKLARKPECHHWWANETAVLGFGFNAEAGGMKAAASFPHGGNGEDPHVWQVRGRNPMSPSDSSLEQQKHLRGFN